MAEKLEHLFTRDKRTRFILRPDSIQFVLCVLIIGCYLVLLSSGRLERIENNFLDYFFRERLPIATHPAIVLIEIGDDSIQAIGRWPWPWHYHAKMVNLLRDWEAKAIAFDLIFKASNVPFENKEFEESLEETKGVYLPVELAPKPEKKFWVHSLPVVLEPQGKQKIWMHCAPELEGYAKAIGHINADTDDDGVLRRIAPYLSNEKEVHPQMAVRIAYDYLGKKLPGPRDLKLPLDRNGNLLINWVGKYKDTFEHFSYSDLVRSDQAIKEGLTPVVPPEAIRDKICLIGLTARDQANFKVNPIEASYPLLGVHANVINSILTGQFVRAVSPTVNAVSLALIGLIASLLFMNFRNITSFVIGLAIGGVWIGISFGLFVLKGIWIYVFHHLLLILSLFIFSALYTQIISRWERSRLFDLATRDGLTGLYVIRYFREILNRMVTESKAKNVPLCLVLMDIDNFKSVNDTYGHPAGDMVLKKVAKIVSDCLRSKRSFQEVDFVARYGGEEFIVILRKTKLTDAVSKVAERIRQSVEQAAFEWDGKKIPITISLGVSIRHPEENVPDHMVRRADDALYHAKKTGKNRVCVEE